jgi:uncharacterized protein
MNSKIVIIGAGTAGISTYLQLKQYNLDVYVIEAGGNLDQRLEANDPYIANGFGGSGLFSDGKWSIFPAGTSLLKQNPYELRRSFSAIIDYLKQALPSYSVQFDDLLASVISYIGDNTVSSEQIERKFQSITVPKFKGYKSVVINHFDDALAILNHLHELVDQKKIIYNTTVTNIAKKDNRYVLTCKGKVTTVVVDKIVCATGRFGAFLINKCNPKPPLTDLSYTRLELGVRVMLDDYPHLKSTLMKVMKDGVKDPKFTTTETFEINGKKVNVKARSFCVCLPKSNSGYCVNVTELSSGLSAYSGSSSFSEYADRQDNPRLELIPGSNMGAMVRITDPETVRLLTNEMFHKDNISKFTGNNPMNKIIMTPGKHIQNSKSFESMFTKQLGKIIYLGINKLIESIIGDKINQPVTVYGPCIEGIGIYPNIDQRTYQLVDDANIYVTGDAVGFARGLMQSMVMGDMCGKYVYNHILNETLQQSGLTRDYQNISLPNSSYNKIITSDRVINVVAIKKQLQKTYQTIISNFQKHHEQIHKRSNEIFTGMSKVKYDSFSPHGGVLYEIHHFFLDKKIYTSSKQLHYISESATIQYILLCNMITDNLEKIALHTLGSTYKSLPQNLRAFWAENIFTIKDSVLKSIANYKLKSCILALRTRTSVESRDEYTDIPVMQSAFKFIPIRFNHYKENNELFNSMMRNIEYYLVSTITSFLDLLIDSFISESDLELIKCRTKVETQEPSVSPVADESLYYECHVKVNIKYAIDNSLVEYYEKKHLIHELAGLLEGDAKQVDIFNVMSVSINLLKHPEFGQQFFLTYRTDTKQEMEFIRRNFSKIVNKLTSNIEKYNQYKLTFYTDAEFVIYDDNRDLDLPWFPITTKFLSPNYYSSTQKLLGNQCFNNQKRKLSDV